MTASLRTVVGWEHTHREMLPAVLLLRELRDRGLAADVEHVLAFREANPGGPAPPQVVMMPFYYDDADLQRYLFRVGVDNTWVVNLAYEQMHLACGRGYLLPDGEFARTEMLHCAWGPRFHELLLEHGIPEERIRLTGHLRFDIYHQPSLLTPREVLAARYGLDPDKPWLLIPGSFNLAYISETLRQRLNARNYHIEQDLIDVTAATRDHFLTLLDTLSAACPDVEVILRVHPAGYESEKVYASPASRRDNVHVIAEFDIANWITQSALVVVWNSTSSMEALVAGVPAVAYEPVPYTDVYDYDVGRILPRLTDASDVVDLARQLPGDLDLPVDWERFERWYAHRDGKNVSRLADVASEADADFSAFRVTAADALGPDQDRRRRWARAGDKVPGLLKKGWKKVFGGATPHPAPPADALDEAVRTLTATPLGDFLK